MRDVFAQTESSLNSRLFDDRKPGTIIKFADAIGDMLVTEPMLQRERLLTASSASELRGDGDPCAHQSRPMVGDIP